MTPSLLYDPAKPTDDKFIPLKHCWTCGGDQLVPIHEARFDLAEYAEQDPGLAAYTAQLPVHPVNAQRLVLEGKQYSAVTMIDVLEHIPDPTKTLTTIRKLLSAGGWAAIKVPCGRNQLLKENVRARLTKSHRIS